METGIDHIINVGRGQQRPNWTILSLVGAAVLIAGALFGSAVTARGWFSGGGEKVPIYVSTDPKVNEQVTLNGGFSAIAKAVTPAVVTINISSRRSQQREIPFMFDPFRDFFDRQSPGDEG